MTSERDHLRKIFFATWEKYNKKEPLSPLGRQLISVILVHPEYHSVLDNLSEQLHQNYTTDTNPFLHMSLHLGLLEQLNTDRPSGIKSYYQQLLSKVGDSHKVEHLIMDMMATFIWEAQRNNTLPDEQAYIEALKRVTKNIASSE